MTDALNVIKTEHRNLMRMAAWCVDGGVAACGSA